MHLPDFPKRITLELSSVCNLKCVMCPRRYLESKGDLMRWSLFEKIINEVSEKQVDAIVPFFRGETLLHPKFKDMITFIREKTSTKIQLATNALLLDKEITDFLLEIDIDFISFSIDALNQETYDKIRLNGNFDLLMENVRCFLVQKEFLEKKTVVQVSATRNKHNKNEMKSFIDHWKSLVDRVRIYPEHSSKGHFGELSPDFKSQAVNRTPCRKLFSEMVILSDGRLSVCNHDWKGEVFKTCEGVKNNSLASVWQGNDYQEARAKHLGGSWNAISPCNRCDHWQSTSDGKEMIGELIT